MKIIQESKKEKLPVDFITQFISKGWDEVGTLKASKTAIKDVFKDTAKVEEVIQDLIDSYLVCIGRMELYLDKKDYLDVPDQETLKEDLMPTVIDNVQAAAEAALPDFEVAVKQDNDKIAIELEPKEDVQDEEVPVEDDSEAFEFYTNFDEPEIDQETRETIHAWLNK